MSKPLISIVTVNYRQPEATVALLESLNRQSYEQLEVILIDNDPIDEYTQQFQAAFSGLRVYVNEENIGFAAANNQGMQLAGGQYLFLLNNDTEVRNGFFEACLRPFADPAIGVVSPMICYFEAPSVIQYAGFTPVNALGQNRTVGQHETDLGQFDRTAETPYAHGAAMLLRREVYERVGGMPEEFFLYYEELAWCARIRQAGFKIVVHPTAKVWHKASLSTGRASTLKTYYLNRNRLRFMWNYSEVLWHRLVFTFYFLLLATPLRIIRFWRKGQQPHARALVRAILDGLTGKFGFRSLAA